MIQNVTLNPQKGNKKLWSATCDLLSPIIISDIFLKDLVKDPSFELVSIEKKTVDEKERVVLKFRCHIIVENGAFLQDGEIVFDPSLQWVIRQSDYSLQCNENHPQTGQTVQEILKSHKQCEYRAIDGIPVLETVELTVDPAAGNRLYKDPVKEKITYHSIEFTSIRQNGSP